MTTSSRIGWTAVSLALCLSTAAAVAGDDGYDGQALALGADLAVVDADGLVPWTERGPGKLRWSGSGLESRAFAAFQGRWRETLYAQLSLESAGDDLGPVVGVTEAYVEWRPIPTTPTRYRLRAGAFYPVLSLENTAAGWSNPYLLTSSAINSWVGEEIRTVGVELAADRRPARLGGVHRFGVRAAVFAANDPAGSLLAWRGFALHSRQTASGDALPLPDLPALSPGGMFFGTQAADVEPFREIDDRAGYSASIEYEYAQRLLVSVAHYDNRADPEAIDDGQYAWHTRFQHAGLRAALPGQWLLLSQWLRGSTVMGPAMNGTRAVDTEFNAAYVLLTRRFDAHRVTARYDDFDVRDIDQLPGDDNGERGDAWTLGYAFQASAAVTVAVEWQKIDSRRPSRQYQGLPAAASEQLLQVAVRLRYR